jgi:hypothetical protein
VTFKIIPYSLNTKNLGLVALFGSISVTSPGGFAQTYIGRQILVAEIAFY